MMGGASMTTNGGTMILYYFDSLDRDDHDEITNGEDQQRPLSSFKSFFASINRRDNRSLAICGLFCTTIQVTLAIGYIHTDPNGFLSVGWFWLSSMFCFNSPLLYFGSRIRNILSQMSPSDISSYLSTNILTIGISSPQSRPICTSHWTPSNV